MRDGYLGEWHAVRQYVSGVSGAAADELIVWFDADLLPGYAWSFPLPDGRANVGFGVLRDGSRSGKDVRDLWAGVLDRPHVRCRAGTGVRHPRVATSPGRSRRGSIGPRSPTDRCCSPAMPLRRPT